MPQGKLCARTATSIEILAACNLCVYFIVVVSRGDKVRIFKYHDIFNYVRALYVYKAPAR